MRVQNTWFRTLALLAVLGISAAAMIIISFYVKPKWIQTLLTNTASFLVASIILAAIYEFWQKKTFLQEIFAEARIVEQVQSAGIVGFSSIFQEKVDWSALFAKSDRLDILFAYGSTWRNTHRHHLTSLLRKENAKLRVVLPDPTNSVIMAEMALRFSSEPSDLISKIEEAIRDLRQLDTEVGGGRIQIFVIGRSLVYSFYRFNSEAVIALYKHAPGRGGVPTFTVQRGGELYGTIQDEWRAITEQGITTGLTRKVYPE